MKKALTILSGVLALFSAGAIATVLADVFGASGTQTVAAITAAISGVISLVMGTYYNDDDIVNLFTGSSKYLALRDNVYRLIIHQQIDDEERYKRLGDLQKEYATLDETYSRFFSKSSALLSTRESKRPLLDLSRPVDRQRVSAAARREVERLHDEIAHVESR
jgi:hypothetical protein